MIMKRILSTILLAAICFSAITAPTHAFELQESKPRVITPQSSSIFSMQIVDISASSSGKIYIDALCVARSVVKKLGISQIKIYEDDVCVATYGSRTGSNISDYSTSITYSGTPGCSYYAMVKFYGYNGTTEYKTVYSATVTP